MQGAPRDTDLDALMRRAWAICAMERRAQTPPFPPKPSHLVEELAEWAQHAAAKASMVSADLTRNLQENIAPAVYERVGHASTAAAAATAEGAQAVQAWLEDTAPARKEAYEKAQHSISSLWDTVRATSAVAMSHAQRLAAEHAGSDNMDHATTSFRQPVTSTVTTPKMSDDDMVEHEAGEAGASTWYPGEAGQVKKGGHILMKGDKPCKVIDIKVSKTGKHGHGKCRFTAIDIFDGSKHEDIIPSTHTAHLPFVNRAEYTVIGIEDGYLQMMTDDGDMKEDLQPPTYPDGLGDDLEAAIQVAEDEGKQVVVSVISAMEKEAVTSFKTVEV